MPLGSLDKILLRFGVVLRTSMKMSMAEQIAAAMAELSSEGVLHRDLAVRNVLVQSLEPVHVKVGTASLACYNGPKQPAVSALPYLESPGSSRLLSKGALTPVLTACGPFMVCNASWVLAVARFLHTTLCVTLVMTGG